MSRADGVLVVSLTFRWWDMIESGEKLEEYRSFQYDLRKANTWFWRLCDDLWWMPWHPRQKFAKYHTLRAQRGYTGVWLERKIRCIRWGTPRPEWSGDTVTGECFIIELEPVA